MSGPPVSSSPGTSAPLGRPAPSPGEQVAEAADWLRRRSFTAPVGVILGTGLGGLAESLDESQSLPFAAIPHFLSPSALGHAGRLAVGRWGAGRVLVLCGRLHAYEGRMLNEITLPVHVLHALGVETLIVSNAAGGLAPNFAAGDLMVIDEHLNLLPTRTGIAAAAGPPASRRSEPPLRPYARGAYDPRLINRVLDVARREQLVVHRGVYAAVAGPNYETRAEQRFLRRIGADAVGMSTVPEVEAAWELGLRVLAVSTMTNVCRPDAPHRASGEDVAAAAQAAAPRLLRLLRGVLD